MSQLITQELAIVVKGRHKGNAKSVVADMEVAYAAELPPVLQTAN